MRPLELELAGFRSYDSATVDWRPHDLVVIAGDTGAGKSTLLDALCFALYGRTPETTRSGDLLTLGREHGEVRLTFARDDEVWRVTRRFGKRAPEPAHILERLAGDGGAPVETIGGEAPVNARVLQLLGLGFAAFTSAVVLAQGRFAQFLQAKAAERDAILRELFDIASLDGARAAAQQAQAAAEARVDVLNRERDRLPEHSTARRSAAARAARAAAERRAALRALGPLSAEVRHAHDRAREMAAAAARIREAAARLPGRTEVDQLAAAVARARDARDAAATTADSAARQADAAADARDRARRRHGATGAELAQARAGAERLAAVAARIPILDAEIAAADVRRGELAASIAPRAELAARLAAHAAAAAATAELEQAERQLADRAAVHEAALSGAQRSAKAARTAAEALAAARRDDHAAALRRGLSPGDACPVCGAAVGTLPVEDTALSAAEEQENAARAHAEEAARHAAHTAGLATAARAARDAACARAEARRATLVAAGGTGADDPAALTAEVERLDGLSAQLQRMDGRREGLWRERADAVEERGALRGQLGAWVERDDPVAALTAALDELVALESAAEAARGKAATAARAAASERAVLTRLEHERVAALRQTATVVAHLIGTIPPRPDAEASDLVAEVAALAATATEVARAAEATAEAARADEEAAKATLAARATPLGVTSIARLEAATAGAGEGLARARAALRDLEDAAAQARRLEAEADAAHADARRRRQLVADLRVDRFPRHLLQRYLTRLAAGASARLTQLSGGAYRFAHTTREPLDVVDVRRGERVRRAATLSGGERFLASLALALGLADVATESGGRLECLFLDEGFSALDAESLEQAMEGVERLAGDGRLVGVITHLPGVAERLGAAIHVHKDAAGASHVGPQAPVGRAAVAGRRERGQQKFRTPG